MRVLAAAALIFLLTVSALAADTVLVGGTIIDGTGNSRVLGNIRIRNGEINAIGAAVRPAAGDAVIDVKGLIVAPGFIDLHNHSEDLLAEKSGAISQITQGITTAIVGQDGAGPIGVENFMAPFDENPPALNIMTFAGHGTLRRRVMGGDYRRAATAEEIGRMSDLLESAMREGAFGLSSGLEFDPGFYSMTDELITLAKVAARYGGLYMSHIRDEGGKVMDAIKEAIEIGRQARIPVQISHIKLGTAAVWGKTAEALGLIDKARAQRVDVAADVYPYEGSSCPTGEVPFPTPPMRDQKLVCWEISDKDIGAFLRHNWVMIASDGGINVQHPRGAGAFPRVLGKFVREEKILTLERAIRKMTGLPASRLGLKERGVLKRGAAADIVVFDPVRVRDLSTVQEPLNLSEGMKYVFVNGVPVLHEGKPTTERPGLALR